ncbi:MAG: hypothetical protein KA099_12485 [Alphaproteobacteria bacterium]|nr:hypothetical protein [Alphaproteobacteria bacterium]MBP7761918.1 hypothetical protein [Alphaproteobacteria bacterium]MBP7906130.1 hypothetical protein [Alphaproteobacteria bacterium]
MSIGDQVMFSLGWFLVWALCIVPWVLILGSIGVSYYSGDIESFVIRIYVGALFGISILLSFYGILCVWVNPDKYRAEHIKYMITSPIILLVFGLFSSFALSWVLQQGSVG